MDVERLKPRLLGRGLTRLKSAQSGVRRGGYCAFPKWHNGSLSTVLRVCMQLSLIHILMGTGVCPHPTEIQDDEGMLRGAEGLLERYPVEMICITMGARGSLLVTRTGRDRHRGLTTRVQDTVGAGDAFTAALTHYYLEGAPLAVLNEAGNRWGAWVASQRGGMPAMKAETLERLSGEIGARRVRA